MKIIFFFFLIALHAYADPLIKIQKKIQNEHITVSHLTKKSSNIKQEITLIKHKTINITKNILTQEKKITLLQNKMFFLKNQLMIKRKHFQRAQFHLFQIFAGLQSISNTGIECFLINPQNPDYIVSASMLLAALPNIFRKKIFQLKKELKNLIIIEYHTQQTYQKMQDTLNVIYSESLSLNKTLNNLKILEQKVQLDKKQHVEYLKKLINQSSSIQSMINNMQHASYGRVFGNTSFQLPVHGKILISFHTKTVFKKMTSDIAISASPGSIVLTPGGGVVMFAGNFKNHGLIIVIKHAHNYYSVLTGMTKILVHIGERVSKGQPVAYLGHVVLDPLIAFKQDIKNNPILHYKLLKNGQPVNPLHYM